MVTYHSEVFNSLHDFRTALQRPANAVFAAALRNSQIKVKDRRNHYAKFYGTLTFEEADRLMIGGYTPAITHIAETMAANSMGEIQRRRRVYSQVGGRLAVNRYLNDSPTPFARRLQRHTTARVITVLINISVPGNILAADMQEAAALILSALLSAENSGTRLNIYTSEVSCNITPHAANAADAYYTACAIKIKDAGEALCVGTVAYPLTHPSMLRRHLFAWLETTPAPGMPVAFAKGYGYPQTKADIIRDAYQNKFNSGVAVINLYDCLYRDANGVTKYVQSCLDDAATKNSR